MRVDICTNLWKYYSSIQPIRMDPDNASGIQNFNQIETADTAQNSYRSYYSIAFYNVHVVSFSI